MDDQWQASTKTLMHEGKKNNKKQTYIAFSTIGVRRKLLNLLEL